jgi:hypothetical protein
MSAPVFRMKENFITLSSHHYESCRALLRRAKQEGKSFEEISQEHADWLVANGNERYAFLSDVSARQNFVAAESHAIERVESEILYDNGAVSVAPDHYTAKDGNRVRFLDYLCRLGCQNYEVADQTGHCKLDGTQRNNPVV